MFILRIPFRKLHKLAESPNSCDRLALVTCLRCLMYDDDEGKSCVIKTHRHQHVSPAIIYSH
ncbi:hypothetical protein E2C01_063748 [Portunus trituberculatus]|uniref:Uncharacterized protein n=1 Tax=Portunus trituberculatus TaxID=210409 RepID=A0A5B7HEI1_PORTR|nr:hypothetical protein [Portunus trituberculatus]